MAFVAYVLSIVFATLWLGSDGAKDYFYQGLIGLCVLASLFPFYLLWKMVAVPAEMHEEREQRRRRLSATPEQLRRLGDGLSAKLPSKGRVKIVFASHPYGDLARLIGGAFASRQWNQVVNDIPHRPHGRKGLISISGYNVAFAMQIAEAFTEAGFPDVIMGDALRSGGGGDDDRGPPQDMAFIYVGCEDALPEPMHGPGEASRNQ